MSTAETGDEREQRPNQITLPEFRGRTSRSAADEALLELVDALRLGEINSGDRLPPLREVATAVGISHANVRQALTVLERVGVVEIKPGRGGGIFVTELGHIPEALASLYPPVPEAEIDMLLEAWSILEREVAILASSRSTREGLDRLRLKLEALEQTDIPVIQFSERTVHFHITAATMARNPFLRRQFAELMNRVAFVGARQGLFDRLSPARRAETVDHYRALYRGIATGDERLIADTVAARLRLERDLRNEQEPIA